VSHNNYEEYVEAGGGLGILVVLFLSRSSVISLSRYNLIAPPKRKRNNRSSFEICLVIVTSNDDKCLMRY
jgi:hypothetical protein